MALTARPGDLHLDNFDDPQAAQGSQYVLTSPRSLMACFRHDVKPIDLLPRPLNEFERAYGAVGYSGEEIHKLFSDFDARRVDMLDAVRAERRRIIHESGPIQQQGAPLSEEVAADAPEELNGDVDEGPTSGGWESPPPQPEAPEAVPRPFELDGAGSPPRWAAGRTHRRRQQTRRSLRSPDLDFSDPVLQEEFARLQLEARRLGLKQHAPTEDALYAEARASAEHRKEMAGLQDKIRRIEREVEEESQQRRSLMQERRRAAEEEAGKQTEALIRREQRYQQNMASRRRTLYDKEQEEVARQASLRQKQEEEARQRTAKHNGRIQAAQQFQRDQRRARERAKVQQAQQLRETASLAERLRTEKLREDAQRRAQSRQRREEVYLTSKSRATREQQRRREAQEHRLKLKDARLRKREMEKTGDMAAVRDATHLEAELRGAVTGGHSVWGLEDSIADRLRMETTSTAKNKGRNDSHFRFG